MKNSRTRWKARPETSRKIDVPEVKLLMWNRLERSLWPDWSLLFSGLLLFFAHVRSI